MRILCFECSRCSTTSFRLLPWAAIYIVGDGCHCVAHGVILAFEHCGERVDVQSSGPALEAGGDWLGLRAGDGAGDADQAAVERCPAPALMTGMAGGLMPVVLQQCHEVLGFLERGGEVWAYRELVFQDRHDRLDDLVCGVTCAWAEPEGVAVYHFGRGQRYEGGAGGQLAEVSGHVEVGVAQRLEGQVLDKGGVPGCPRTQDAGIQSHRGGQWAQR